MTLEIITAGSLPLRHGFFTRRGGASSGIFAGLNCGPSSSDQAEIVEMNRVRVARAMEIATEKLLSVHQIHSATVLSVSGPLGTPRPKADALVSTTPGLGLAVLTADCAPVLLADPEAGVIGAAHAGWKGAFGGVLEATLDAMEALGAARQRTTAVVGPAISQAAYEVGPEFFGRFLDADTANARFFVNGRGDRWLFDLPSFVLHRLRSAGVGHAEWIRACTFSEPERFYSYRRSLHRGEADYGRLISVIRL